MKRKAGRPKKHKSITVRQKDDYNKYHRQYRKVRKKEPLPMGELFTKKDEKSWI